MEDVMIPQLQFDQITKALEEINKNPLRFKKIPEKQRGVLLVALETLKTLDHTSTGVEVNNVLQILKIYKDNPLPKYSLSQRIQNQIKNLFGRVPSKRLVKLSHEVLQDLWLKRGEALVQRNTTESDGYALTALNHANELGSIRAKTLLAQMYLHGRVSKGNGEDHQIRINSYLESAAKGKDPIAQRILGQRWIAMGNRTRGISFLKKAAAQNDLEAKGELKKYKK